MKVKMCEWSKWGDTRIDPCMRNLVKELNTRGIMTIMCCCGHGKYKPTILIYSHGGVMEMFSGKIWKGTLRKKFYKRDKEGIYFIPEVKNG